MYQGNAHDSMFYVKCSWLMLCVKELIYMKEVLIAFLYIWQWFVIQFHLVCFCEFLHDIFYRDTVGNGLLIQVHV